MKRFSGMLLLLAVGCGSVANRGSDQGSSAVLADGGLKPRLSQIGICSEEDGFGLLAPACRTLKSISTLLESGTVGLGLVTAYCAVVPEPVTKATMVITAVGTGITSTLKFVVDNLPCENEDEPVRFTDAQRKEIERMICQSGGGKLAPGGEECYRPVPR